MQYRTSGLAVSHFLPFGVLLRVLPAVRPSRCVLVQMRMGVQLEYHIGSVNLEEGQPQVQRDRDIASYSTREQQTPRDSFLRWMLSGCQGRPWARDRDLYPTDQRHPSRRCGGQTGTLMHQVSDRIRVQKHGIIPAGSRTALTDIDNRED